MTKGVEMTTTIARHIVFLLGILAAMTMFNASSSLAGSEQGKALYEKQCKTCHSVAGEAGKMANMGGALDGVGAKRDDAWLRAYLKDPKSQIEGAKMPKPTLNDEQMNDIVAYLLTLKTPAPAK